MNYDLDHLYALLPAIHRVRDAERGEPLRALISALAEQAMVLEESMAQLYDDQFVETCAEWVVPYIGDLVGARGLHAPAGSGFSERVQVANTLGYRRRKGTAAVLEQLARDVTGWNAHAVEFFQRLITTQYMNHIRLGNLATPDLRRWEPLELLPTPFDTLDHTLEVRRIASRRGKYAIPNVGLFLWRIGAYTSTEATPFEVDARRYTFDPLGRSFPLYSQPVPETAIEHLAERVNVPMPISRRTLAVHKDLYYGHSLSLRVNDVDVEAGDVAVCNLSDFAGGWAHTPRSTYAVDPVLGRLALPDSVPDTPAPDVRVSFNYGFSADLGGGEYDRAGTLDDELRPLTRVPTVQADLQTALDDLGGAGAVELVDNAERTLVARTPDSIHVAAAGRVELRAANQRRPLLRLSGELVVVGDTGAELTLDGLLIAGAAIVVRGDLSQLTIRHCTLVPGLDAGPLSPDEPSLKIEAPTVRVRIERSIVGAIRAPLEASVEVVDSVVDANGPERVAYAATGDAAAGALTLESCTVIGRIHAHAMPLATNAILLADAAAAGEWTAPVRVDRRQEGCVRFSFVPPAASVPRRFRCRPAAGDDPATRPAFTSRRLGDAAYLQLDDRCPVELREGADDGAEMGAFHLLFQPQREANLRQRLDEYLRLGLEAGIFHAS
ncbi:MAG TPA: hypothetical protein VGM91_23260 [Conexibacter sp.]